jgi:hypothetical protein
MLNRIYSTDSAKAIKADAYGYLNAIHYMAPHKVAGVGNLCSHASTICIELCLGLTSGQAGMVHDIDSNADQGNSVRASRKAKAVRFMKDRARYLLDMVRATDRVLQQAAAMGKLPCVRPNGSTDVAYEGIRFTIVRNDKGYAVAVTLGGTEGKNIFDHYPTTQFVDYTKNHTRLSRKLPSNYHLTLSRSEENEAQCLVALAVGHNVAVIFHGTRPDTWNGYRVIDGDQHDLRHLDPRGAIGVVVGLSPKGRKAKKDTRGFVVRDYASTRAAA